jgi:proton-dependent oligopeptide transporter, POT family
VTGLTSLFAGDFSGMVPEPTGTTAIATNPEYSKLFSRLGWGSFIAGVAMIALIRLLRKLIQDPPPPTQESAEKASPSRCS